MGWIIALIIVAVLALGVGALICAPWSPLHKEHEQAAGLTIAEVDFGRLEDGTYTGEYSGGMYGWRANQVRVTVESGRVTAIEPAGPAQPDQKFPERDTIYQRVMEEQSLQVDAVSGATLTSKAYLKGLEDALLRAGEK